MELSGLHHCKRDSAITSMLQAQELTVRRRPDPMWITVPLGRGSGKIRARGDPPPRGERLIRACGVSDAGPVRKTNEDRFVSDTELNLFAVADGMGGHRAGDVASRLAIEALTAFVRISVGDTDVTWPYGIDPKLSFDGNRLRTGICLANRRVFRASENSDDYAGMGTTMVGVLVNGPDVAIGSVGDSRIYLFSKGALEQLTVDDSWATRILSQDASLGPDELAKHPMRNVLTNVVGARETVDVHVAERSLSHGESLLLCTDGLHGVVQLSVMEQILESTSDVEAAAHALVERALERGTRDNVTALVIRYEADR